MNVFSRLARHFRRHPLSYRLLATILAFSSLFTLLGTGVQLYWEYRTDLVGIDETLQQVGISHLESLTTSQWMLDDVRVDGQLQGILRLPDVVLVELEPEGGGRARSLGMRGAGRHREQTYPLIHHYRGEDLTIGTLRVVVSLEGVFQRLRDKFLVILGTQGLRTFATSLFILFLVQFVITRHLHTLADFAQGTSLGRLDVPLALDRGPEGPWRPDELDRVEQALEAMRRRLVEGLADLERGRQEREGLIADLEAKNDEMERFAYTVSHDLKSPLITIQSFLGLIRRDLEKGRSDRIDRDFERIARAAAGMFDMLDDLLALSRVGRLVGEPEPVDLGGLLAEVAEVVDGPRAAKGVALEIADDLPTVAGDPTRLRTVFQNLIENSIKFIGKGETPRIAVTARLEKDFAEVAVEDNGIGIDPEKSEGLFDLFRQEDCSAEGSGIGLALVQRIVRVHGGRVWVESEGLGQGCRIALTLPLAAANVPK